MVISFFISADFILNNNASLGYRQPSTAYATGNIAYHASLPTGWYLECTTDGITASGDLTISSPSVTQTITDGAVTWTVRKTLSTALGTMDGSIIRLKNDNGALLLMGASSSNNGARAEFYGKDFEYEYAGWFALFTANPSKGLFGIPNGQLLWDGTSLDKAAVVSFNPSQNGYIKYASGMTMQWGIMTLTNNYTQVALPINYNNNLYKIIVTGSGGAFLDEYSIYKTWGQMHNEFSIYAQTYTDSQNVQWFTIGY